MEPVDLVFTTANSAAATFFLIKVDDLRKVETKKTFRLGKTLGLVLGNGILFLSLSRVSITRVTNFGFRKCLRRQQLKKLSSRVQQKRLEERAF